MRIGVSGTGGFVGRGFVRYLKGTGDEAVAVKRGQPLPKCDVLVHIAGLAHRHATYAEFMAANRDLTVDLAQSARDLGTTRIVFVSSIASVAGHSDQVLTPDMAFSPLGPYGESKAAAEQALMAMDGLETVVLRPPLVFGPGAKGNFATLIRICASGVPLPFASVHNRRSMVGISNLCSALHFLCRADLTGRIFHVREKEFSLEEIIAICRRSMGLTPRLFPMSPQLIRCALKATGRGHMASQLVDDLIVDDASLREAGWMPTPTDDMARMARETRV